MSETWLHAAAATDMNLRLGDVRAVHALRDSLLEEANLMDAWGNLRGRVPDMIRELIDDDDDSGGADMVATRVANTHYNYLKMRRSPVHMLQVASLAARHIGPDVTHHQHRRKSYTQTRRAMMEHGLSLRCAAAAAYHLHKQTSSSSTPPPTPELEIVQAPPGEVDHLDLPVSYLGVDVDGRLWVIDTTRGVARVRMGSRLPTKWIHRVSSSSNMFLAGDDQRCVGIVLARDMRSGVEVPVTIPHHPSEPPDVVDNTWLVWGDVKHPHSIRWDPDHGLRESATAKLQVMSRPRRLVAAGNQVSMGEEAVTSIPDDQSITCVCGTPTSIDLVTDAMDFYRIDVQAHKAWCVGIDVNQSIVAMTSIVNWM